jgi:rhamnogalacturonan endolyase
MFVDRHYRLPLFVLSLLLACCSTNSSPGNDGTPIDDATGSDANISDAAVTDGDATTDDADAGENNPPVDLGQGLDEVLSRALIALPQDGAVFLGWRVLAEDTDDTVYNLYRKAADEADFTQIASVDDRSSYLDETVDSGQTYQYSVRAFENGLESSGTRAVEVTVAGNHGYVSTPIETIMTTVIRGCVGDLDGDGRFDYVFRTGNTIDSTEALFPIADTDSYHLEAFLSDGTWLWEFDLNLGTGVDGGDIWRNSYSVYDLDGDGLAEVITRAIIGYEDYLVVLDGQSGEIVNQAEWPTYDLVNDNRHVHSIAFLDGVNPHIVAQTGTYTNTHIWAYDPSLTVLWQRHNPGDGDSGHGLRIVDYDLDGNDEILMGDNLLDENGELVWTKNLLHVDMMVPGNIDPFNPGYEVAFASEGQPPGLDSVSVVDMISGEFLWQETGWDHLHESDYVADVTDAYPGWEISTFDPDQNISPVFYTSQGQRIEDGVRRYNRAPLWWENDGYWETTDWDGYVYNYGQTPALVHAAGHSLVRGDLVGDNRDEWMTVVNDSEIRIYTNTAVSPYKRRTPLLDRYYRVSLTQSGTGYYRNVQLLDPQEFYGD